MFYQTFTMLLNSSFLTFFFFFLNPSEKKILRKGEAASWKELKFLFHSYLFAPNNDWVFQSWNGIRQEKELPEKVAGNWQNKQLVARKEFSSGISFKIWKNYCDHN